MADFSEVFFSSITEINAKLRAKEFSCAELTRAFCERLEKLGPQYNALALSFKKEAIRQAHDVDGDLHRDRTRGPLQGIPYGVKDLLAVKGKPTTWAQAAGEPGFRRRRAHRREAQQDRCDFVRQTRHGGAGRGRRLPLRFGFDDRAGTQSVGQDAMERGIVERVGRGGCGGAGYVRVGVGDFGLHHHAGCILRRYGSRPTYGLVSRRGAMALSWTLDKIGPLCRTAEDCALVLHVIAGSDDQDPGSADRSFSYNPQFVRKPADLTIGYAPVDFDEWAAPNMRTGLQEALRVIKGLGFQTKEVELPDFPYGALVGTIIAGEAGSIFEDFIRSGQVDQLADPSQIAGLKTTLETPAVDYLRAMRVRTLVQQGLRDLFLDCDLLLSPARTDTAPSASEPLDGGRIGPRPSSRGLNGLIPAGNLAGLPAISLPCGFADGLPIAISLVSRPFYENQLCAIGAAFQSQTDWHRRKPPVAE